jgi:hypothetical protein
LGEQGPCPGQPTSSFTNTPTSHDHDSDNDSEFDELLQFQAFSSTQCSGSPAFKKQKTEPIPCTPPTATTETTSVTQNVVVVNTMDSVTTTHDDRADSVNDSFRHDTDVPLNMRQDADHIIYTRALKKAETSSVPDGIKHPNMLFWRKLSHRKKIGKSKRGNDHCSFQWYPCRTCSPDEVSGLNLPQKWDVQKKVLVQYLEGTGFTTREIVLKNHLVPHYGEERNMKGNGRIDSQLQNDGGNLNNNSENFQEHQYEWCPVAMREMSNRNRKSRKKLFHDETCVLAMELYMKKVMDTAVQRMNMNLTETNDEEAPYKVKDDDNQSCSSPLKSELQDRGSNNDEKFSSCTNSLLISQDACEHEVDCSHEANSDDESAIVLPFNRTKETLRAGDVIEYYQPNMVFGDDRAYRKARIDEIACKKEMVLKLQGGDYLDRDQRVKRLQKMSRGKLVPCDEEWVHLRNFRLRSGKLKGIEHGGILEEAKQMKESISRNKEMMKKTLKSEGLEMFGDFLN